MMKVGYICAVIFLMTCVVISTGGECAACESAIWCHGDLLHAIQTSELFQDSKTFVDMNLKTDPETVLAAFQSLNQTGSLSKATLQLFLDHYFEGPDGELEQWTPTDYNESPEFLSKIKDKTLRQFGKDMCQIWSHLGRKMKTEVKIHPERYSIIPLDNPFIVPGGRFREIYYWDSYWVVKGLLVCEMYETVKGILENFVSLIQRFGLVPNGGRHYYTMRSQPPLLVPMVQLYIQRSGDTQFLEKNLQFLIQENKFWNDNRSVTVPRQNYKLYRYNVDVDKPRPESYLEDLKTNTIKQNLTGNMNNIFSDLASAAESGWDFSSRWFSQEYNQTSNESQWLSYTRTSDVLPVDLNSILCWNERILAGFHDQLGNSTGALCYERRYNDTKSYIQETFWNDTDGTWYDYSLSQQGHRKQFYPSNLFPLFVGCFNESDKALLDLKTLRYLQRTDVLHYQTGAPTSTIRTGQQWDFPNAWPPLQDAIITSLDTSELEESRKLALKLASNWISSNLIGFQQNGAMFEKYVVNALGSRGAGGEYNVQEGFGWTNGFVLDLLERYGHNLRVASYNHPIVAESKAPTSYTSPVSMAVIIMLTLSLI